MRAPSYVANFASATAMLRATARYLRGEAFPVLGVVPGSLALAMGLVAAAVNALPVRMRERVYARSGWKEAIPPEKLGRVRAEEVS